MVSVMLVSVVLLVGPPAVVQRVKLPPIVPGKRLSQQEAEQEFRARYLPQVKGCIAMGAPEGPFPGYLLLEVDANGAVTHIDVQPQRLPVRPWANCLLDRSRTMRFSGGPVMFQYPFQLDRVDPPPAAANPNAKAEDRFKQQYFQAIQRCAEQGNPVRTFETEMLVNVDADGTPASVDFDPKVKLDHPWARCAVREAMSMHFDGNSALRFRVPLLVPGRHAPEEPTRCDVFVRLVDPEDQHVAHLKAELGRAFGPAGHKAVTRVRCAAREHFMVRSAAAFEPKEKESLIAALRETLGTSDAASLYFDVMDRLSTAEGRANSKFVDVYLLELAACASRGSATAAQRFELIAECDNQGKVVTAQLSPEPDDEPWASCLLQKARAMRFETGPFQFSAKLDVPLKK